MTLRTPEVADRFAAFGTTIFAEVTRLATLHAAVNLGQGFPDFDGPQWIKDAAIRAITDGKNQYCRTHGVPELGAAIASHHRHHYGLAWDPDTEITITTGATEALFATFIGLCNPGDEVVLFEPFYDSYLAGCAAAGAIPKIVTLRADAEGRFSFDPAELSAAFSSRTRAIVVNTPHNPTGTVLTRQELDLIARLARQHDALVITDEVYEHILFEGEHVPMASLLGLRDRTVTISSTGKTFSFTGWKIGYVLAPPALTAGVRAAHQFMTFCSGTPFQHAMAEAFTAPPDFYTTLRAEYLQRRNRLCDGLAEVGFKVHVPQGTYFVVTDIRPMTELDADAFCRALPAEAGVAAIPATSFYANKSEGAPYVRWAFCKTDAVLDEAIRRLRAWGQSRASR